MVIPYKMLSRIQKEQKVDESEEMDNRELARRFFGLVWPYRWYLIPSMVSMILLASTSGALALMVQPVLDRVFIDKDSSMLRELPFLIIGLFALRGVLFFVQSYFMSLVGIKVVRNLQVTLYSHLLRLDMAFFLNHSTGSLMSRVVMDSQMIRRTASSVLSDLLQEGVTVISLVGVLFYQDAELALISLVGFPAAGYAILRFGRRIRRLTKRRQEMLEGVMVQLEETFSGLRVVRAFGMEWRERVRFRQLTAAVQRNDLRTTVVQSVSKPTIDMIAGLAICGVIIYGGSGVSSGATTTGAFFSFLTALLMAYNPIKRLSGINNNFQTGMASAKRIFVFLDLRPTITDPPKPVRLEGFNREIRFENVSFSYGPELPEVVKGVNLTVRAGERVALVGKSGSGKTTLVNLVPRFFDVTAGRILIDGVDLRELTLRNLREQIAMVTQEVILFNDTVRNNIAYGSHHPSPEAVVAAAGVANAREFIEQLPNQYDTMIGDRGIRLSGGQRQRLSIARSVLRDSPILILDEATSALDSESEIAVQEALEHLMSGRTSLVIAHRLSTIRTADRIVVLREGAIVEEGSHDELLALNGEYARLYELQFRE